MDAGLPRAQSKTALRPEPAADEGPALLEILSTLLSLEYVSLTYYPSAWGCVCVYENFSSSEEIHFNASFHDHHSIASSWFSSNNLALTFHLERNQVPVVFSNYT